jgi:hypothetical protein
MIGQSEVGSSSRIIFITLIAGIFAVPSSISYCAKMLGQNPGAEPNCHILTFLHPIDQIEQNFCAQILRQCVYLFPMGRANKDLHQLKGCKLHFGTPMD